MGVVLILKRDEGWEFVRNLVLHEKYKEVLPENSFEPGELYSVYDHYLKCINKPNKYFMFTDVKGFIKYGSFKHFGIKLSDSPLSEEEIKFAKMLYIC